MATLSSAPSRSEQLVATMLQIVAERGLESLTVREVAAATGVSIGTVQHYFPTKDDMLAATMAEVADRTRSRIEGVRLGSDIRANLAAILRELLPLDRQRTAEARVQLAFAARAAVSDRLAATQRQLIAEIVGGLTEAFLSCGQSRATATTSARVVLAATDGLAQHAVSTGDVSGRQQTTALNRLLDLLC